MDSVLTNKLKITLLALGLSAAAAPAAAMTNITSCGEINQPGSYQVTQNLSHLNSKGAPQCLLIDANDVTIDLQGHAITGDGSESSIGIAAPRTSTLSNIEVRKGTVMSFGIGIHLGKETRGARVERMHVFDNKSHGIIVGSASVVSSNIVAQNGGIGILVGQRFFLLGGSLVIDNLASENGDFGLVVERGSTVRGNLANHNSQAGIEVDCPSLVSDNTTVFNAKTLPLPNLSLVGQGCRSNNNVAPAK